MRRFVFFGAVFAMIALINCSDDCGGLFSACDSGPFFGDLNVRVTINNENPEVEIIIFKGKVEKRDTLIHEFIDGNTTYSLLADNYYSGMAFYKDGFKEITAINGKRMDTETDDCDCEYAHNINLNLKLAR